MIEGVMAKSEKEQGKQVLIDVCAIHEQSLIEFDLKLRQELICATP
jgi:hypothetical protein